MAIPGTKWRFSSLVDFPASHRLKPVASPKFGGFAKCQRCLKMQYKWTPKKDAILEYIFGICGTSPAWVRNIFLHLWGSIQRGAHQSLFAKLF